MTQEVRRKWRCGRRQGTDVPQIQDAGGAPERERRLKDASRLQNGIDLD